MRFLPWDKQYLKIAFHVVITLFFVILVYFVVRGFPDFIASAWKIISRFFGAISPLFVAFIIAYLFDPIVDFFQAKYEFLMNKYVKTWLEGLGYKKKKSAKATRKKSTPLKKRTAGTALTYLVFFGLLVFAGIALARSIGSTSSFDSVIHMVTDAISRFSNLVNGLQNTFNNEKLLEKIQLDEIVNNAAESLTSFLAAISSGIAGTAAKTGSIITNLVIGFTLGFYLLKDKYIILYTFGRLVKAFIPNNISSRLKAVVEDIDAIFSGYIRGQLLDALIVAILISITLSIIGVKFPVFIGIISGVLNIIPYFGSIFAFVLAIAISLISGEWTQALISAIALIIIQQIDGNLIGPKIVGESVSLHPAVVLVAITAAGSLFGLGGMIIAVPVVAVTKLFLARYVRRYQKLKKMDGR